MIFPPPDCCARPGCVHWRGPKQGVYGLFCDAFPDGSGIPDPIFRSLVKHTSPYPGDHDIQYEAGAPVTQPETADEESEDE